MFELESSRNTEEEHRCCCGRLKLTRLMEYWLKMEEETLCF